MASSKITLTDYAAKIGKNAPGSQAWLPSIKEWPEILEAWQSGAVDQSQIRCYLIDICGYSAEQATRARIAYLTKQYPRTRRA
jgi:hypothetical protein